MEILKEKIYAVEKALNDVIFNAENNIADEESIKLGKDKFIASLDDLFLLEEQREEAFGQIVLALKKAILSNPKIDSRKCDGFLNVFPLLNEKDLEDTDTRWAKSQLRLAGFKS